MHIELVHITLILQGCMVGIHYPMHAPRHVQNDSLLFTPHNFISYIQQGIYSTIIFVNSRCIELKAVE